ncbi:hypothetical protein V5799_033720 [Amblyomma americanum]|uniref:Gem-associated protein 5 TPR domain-containing protein n=1 Tax=Amblyomma americanum TaxID=6943 RepID=A0AAQ4DMH8_AMBAM
MFCRCERADADDVPALLTVSVDGKVQVWDVKDGAVKHTTLSQSSACCADWRGSLSTSVVFTGKSSTLLLWNIATGSVAPVERPVDQEITILRSHPTDPDIVAIGYYNGFVIVQGLMKRGSNMIYKLKGHNGIVLSLSWNTNFSPKDDGTQHKQLCLCSTAFDRTLKIWNVSEEKFTKSLKAPLSNKNKKFDTREKWTAACWIPGSGEAIVSSSATGDVCIYEPGATKEWTFLDCDADSGGHSSAVYNICLVGGTQGGTKLYAVSASEDRNIIFWDLAARKSAYCIPSLAVGVGDGSIKVWRTDCIANPYSAKVFTFENQPKESRSGDVQYLTDILAKQEGGPIELNPEHSHLGMFTTTSGALSVLDTEIRYHKREHNLDYAFQMMAWKGDTAVALREAAAERRLTDTLVALAPSVSRALWYEMCERYAAQLLSDGEHHRAVLYYLACRKVKEALKLLCDNSLHREALSIARAHLSDDDPEIHQIYASWAERAVGVGNFELAAKCYLAIGDPSKAVASLMNRKDPYSLRSAAYVAKKNGLLAEMEMSFQAALQCSLIHNEWEQTAHFVEEQGRSRAFLSFVQLHKALVESVNEISQQKKDAAEDQDSTTKVLWSSQDDVAASFLSSVVSAFESNGYSPLKSTLGFTELSEMLGYGKHASKTVLLHDTKDHVLFHIAGCLVVALFSPDQWKLFFARALSAAYQHDRKLFNNLCRLLFRGKVADSAFAGGLTIDINPGHCLLFDRLEATADSMAASFECPPSSRDLWANFNSLSTNAEAQADPGREVLLLYLCETLLDACCESESAGTRVPFAQSISSLMFSPTIACLEHLSHKLTSAERNLLTWRSELSVKKASGEESNTTEDELARSVLEEEVELCKRQLQEMKAAAFDCPFPPLTQVFRRLVQLLESTEDKSCTELKAQLEAWVQLVLDV